MKAACSSWKTATAEQAIELALLFKPVEYRRVQSFIVAALRNWPSTGRVDFEEISKRKPEAP